MRRNLTAFAAISLAALWCAASQAQQEDADSDPSHYLVVRLTADAFGSLTDRSIDRVTSVNEIILGTPVVGSSRTTGRPQVKLQENPREAGFLVELKGTTVSRTRGYGGPVVVRSRTTTHFHSKKYVVFVPGEGFRSGPATTEARSESVTEGIDPNRGGLIGRIIQRRASETVAERRPQTQAIARDKAIRRLNKMFDEYLEGRLAKLNQRVAMIATLAALRGQEGEPNLFCCSTKDHVLIALDRGRSEFNVQLPELPGPRPPVQFWVYKSLLGGERGQRLLGMARTGLAVQDLFAWSQEFMPAQTLTTASKPEELPALKMSLDATDDWYVIQLGEIPAAAVASASR